MITVKLYITRRHVLLGRVDWPMPCVPAKGSFITYKLPDEKTESSFEVKDVIYTLHEDQNTSVQLNLVDTNG